MRLLSWEKSKNKYSKENGERRVQKLRGGLSPFKLYEYQNIELDSTFHV